VGEVAVPELLVCTVAVAAVPNKALAPEAEAAAVNVTLTLAIGFPLLSFTVTTKGATKLVFTWVVWLPPDTAAIELAAPAVLVRAKVAGIVTPAELAVTV
jgi:hypothetical protein